MFLSAAAVILAGGETVSLAEKGGVPLCDCQEHFGFRRAVKGPVAQHGEQQVASASCERNEGLVMALSLADLASLVRPGERIAQSREGRQEHRPLQLFVSAPRRQFTADGRARAPREVDVRQRAPPR